MGASMKMRKAILAGATGLVGSHVLAQLLDDRLYSKVHVLLRRKIELEDPRLVQHIIKFDDLDKVQIGDEIDDLYCTLGTTIKKAGSQGAFRKVDHDYVIGLAKLASGKGIRKFLVISSLGANPNSKVFYTKVKGKMEAAIQDLNIEEIHIFRPSFLIGKRDEFRIGERITLIFMKIFFFLFLGGMKKYKPIPAKIVASSMIQNAKTKGKSVNIHDSRQIWELYERGANK